MKQATLRTILDEAVSNGRLVGAVLAVAHRGELVCHAASGLMDRETDKMAELSTRFRLASLSKAIVTMTALTLVDAGRLALDDKVSRYLPEFRPMLANGYHPDITIRQLLSHTAGLSYFPDGEAPNGISGDGLDMAQAMNRIASQSLLHRPGTVWQYSIAIDVLGAVIEKAAGTSLPSAVEQAVTGPLGMVHTGFRAEPEQLAVAYADGPDKPLRIHGLIRIITQSNEAFPAEPARAFNSGSYPSGGAGLIGTAGDYLRFLEAIRRRETILSPGLWDMALGDQVAGLQRIPPSPGVGFGFLGSVVKDPLLAASPFSPGSISWGGVYGNTWWVDFAAGLSVVLLTNTATEGLEGPTVQKIQQEIYASLSAAA